MPPVFRERPPIELVEQVLKTFGLQNISDANWFSKQQIHLKEFEELLPQIEPFYIPCKAKDYIHKTINVNRAITILRQLLRCYSANLTSMEKSRGGQKNTWYQIQNDNKSFVDLEDGVIIDFS
jgi:hypothetical protein